MLKTWEKVFFTVVILIVVAVAIFHKEIKTLFAGRSQQEQVIDVDKKKENKNKKEKKDKKDNDDNKDKDDN